MTSSSSGGSPNTTTATHIRSTVPMPEQREIGLERLRRTVAHALHHLIDELDLSAFDAHYRNDETGATAHDPAMLLRAGLLGYSQGLVS